MIVHNVNDHHQWPLLHPPKQIVRSFGFRCRCSDISRPPQWPLGLHTGYEQTISNQKHPWEWKFRIWDELQKLPQEHDESEQGPLSPVCTQTPISKMLDNVLQGWQRRQATWIATWLPPTPISGIPARIMSFLTPSLGSARMCSLFCFICTVNVHKWSFVCTPVLNLWFKYENHKFQLQVPYRKYIFICHSSQVHILWHEFFVEVLHVPFKSLEN